MKYKVYIDGQEGTTGLQLQKRLSVHDYVELCSIDPDKRKDPEERKKFINNADIVFLCLPDAAAKEAVSLCENPDTKIIDASTAHRTNPAWAYGFPELSAAMREAVKTSKRIANPGCHATGFIAAAYPLVAGGIAPASYPFCCHSITGYSGGGKKMIAQYNDEARPYTYDSPRTYGLTLTHKHLPEMKAVCGLDAAPIFQPIVCDFYSGMSTSIPLHKSLLKKDITVEELKEFYREYYKGQPLISICDAPADGTLAANTVKQTCQLQLYIFGNDTQFTVTSVFDNLGKGASGAAVQNMNVALGLEDMTCLAEGDLACKEG